MSEPKASRRVWSRGFAHAPEEPAGESAVTESASQPGNEPDGE